MDNKEEHKYDENGNLIQGYWDGYNLVLGTKEMDLLNGFAAGYTANKNPERAKEFEKGLVQGSAYTLGYNLGKEKYSKDQERQKLNEIENDPSEKYELEDFSEFQKDIYKAFDAGYREQENPFPEIPYYTEIYWEGRESREDHYREKDEEIEDDMGRYNRYVPDEKMQEGLTDIDSIRGGSQERDTEQEIEDVDF